MCELIGMTLAELRDELKLSLEEFAGRLGLKSKGYASQLERGDVGCSVEVALKIEKLSEGRIQAATLNPDVARVEQARGIGQTADHAA